MTRKVNSRYHRKNGDVMKQINITVREDIADKFEDICAGISKSAIFTQLIEKEAKKQLVSNATKYSILSD